MTSVAWKDRGKAQEHWAQCLSGLKLLKNPAQVQAQGQLYSDQPAHQQDWLYDLECATKEGSFKEFWNLDASNSINRGEIEAAVQWGCV